MIILISLTSSIFCELVIGLVLNMMHKNHQAVTLIRTEYQQFPSHQAIKSVP